MRNLVMTASVAVALLVTGCAARPTLKTLTYQEASLLREAEVRKLDWLRVRADEAGDPGSRQRMHAAWEAQADRVEKVSAIAEAAWERESH